MATPSTAPISARERLAGGPVRADGCNPPGSRRISAHDRAQAGRVLVLGPTASGLMTRQYARHGYAASGLDPLKFATAGMGVAASDGSRHQTGNPQAQSSHLAALLLVPSGLPAQRCPRWNESREGTGSSADAKRPPGSWLECHGGLRDLAQLDPCDPRLTSRKGLRIGMGHDHACGRACCHGRSPSLKRTELLRRRCWEPYELARKSVMIRRRACVSAPCVAQALGCARRWWHGSVSSTSRRQD